MATFLFVAVVLAIFIADVLAYGWLLARHRRGGSLDSWFASEDRRIARRPLGALYLRYFKRQQP